MDIYLALVIVGNNDIQEFSHIVFQQKFSCTKIFQQFSEYLFQIQV